MNSYNKTKKLENKYIIKNKKTYIKKNRIKRKYKFKVSFYVYLITDYEKKKVKRNQIKQIQKWYEKRMIDFQKDNLYPDFIYKITTDNYKNKIIISGKTNAEKEENMFILDYYISDPDDDGNYPLELNNKKYLISPFENKYVYTPTKI